MSSKKKVRLKIDYMNFIKVPLKFIMFMKILPDIFLVVLI